MHSRDPASHCFDVEAWRRSSWVFTWCNRQWSKHFEEVQKAVERFITHSLRFRSHWFWSEVRDDGFLCLELLVNYIERILKYSYYNKVAIQEAWLDLLMLDMFANFPKNFTFRNFKIRELPTFDSGATYRVSSTQAALDDNPSHACANNSLKFKWSGGICITWLSVEKNSP